MPPTTIDNATKVNIGILITLLVSTAGGATYLGSLRGTVMEVGKSVHRMEVTIERLASQSQIDGRALESMKSRMIEVERRIGSIEQRAR